jgi:hypothetical protein
LVELENDAQVKEQQYSMYIEENEKYLQEIHDTKYHIKKTLEKQRIDIINVIENGTVDIFEPVIANIIEKYNKFKKQF